MPQLILHHPDLAFLFPAGVVVLILSLLFYRKARHLRQSGEAFETKATAAFWSLLLAVALLLGALLRLAYTFQH